MVGVASSVWKGGETGREERGGFIEYGNGDP